MKILLPGESIMKKSWLYILVLSLLVIGYIVWQGWQADRQRHREYGRVIMEYIDTCEGTRIEEMYIVKGEKHFSIRCEEVNGEEIKADIFI